MFHPFISEKNTIDVINDIITYVKLFSGDIYGDCIRDYRIGLKTNISNIDIRIEPVYLKPLITLINIKYTTDELLPIKEFNGININTLKITSKSVFIFNSITINIVLMTYKMFRVSFIDFDVNLITENDQSLYLRLIPYAIKYISDKLSFVKNRIQNKTFSCLDVYPGERSLTDLTYIIEKAIVLTKQGWMMDDLLQNKMTWIVGTWNGFKNGQHKKKITQEKHKQLIATTECSLCQEQFDGTDIVINTACNHTFHWNCNNTNGLLYWVKKQNKSSCPCCRAEMFY